MAVIAQHPVFVLGLLAQIARLAVVVVFTYLNRS